MSNALGKIIHSARPWPGRKLIFGSRRQNQERLAKTNSVSAIARAALCQVLKGPICPNRLINLPRRDYGAVVKRGGKRNVPGGTRTHNLLIRSQMLYPVELQTQENFRFSTADFRLKNAAPGMVDPNLKIENPKSKMRWGGRRDSNPQQPEPQSGALPLSYDHHVTANSSF